MQGEKYSKHVGEKFHADGSVRSYPGNTIICFIDFERHKVVYERSLWVQNELQKMPWRQKFTLLPPSSFHMTVMDLLVDQVRTPVRWSSKIPLSATLEEADAFFLRTVPTVPTPERLRMRFTGIRKPAMIELEPADKGTEAAIWAYRNQIAEVTGVRTPEHELYKFHVSTAYPIVHLTPEEESEYETMLNRLGQIIREADEIYETERPQLTFFDNMFRFVPEHERHMLSTR